MTNCHLEQDEWRDYEAINIYGTLQTMMHLPKFIAKKVVQRMTRDHARTPVQWDDSDYAGFSDHQPWIKVNPNYKQINLKSDLVSETSINHWYKQAIALRKAYSAFNTGAMTPVLVRHKQILAYQRSDEQAEFLILINLSGSPARFDLKTEGRILMDSYTDPQPQLLRPYEARLIQIR